MSFTWLLHRPPLAPLAGEDVDPPCADVRPAHNCCSERDGSGRDSDAAVGGFDCIAVAVSRSLSSA